MHAGFKCRFKLANVILVVSPHQCNLPVNGAIFSLISVKNNEPDGALSSSAAICSQ